MWKRIRNRMTALCTCTTLMVAAPMSLDGCQLGGSGGVLGGWGGETQTASQHSASASAGEGFATATASSSTTTTDTQGGFFGGLGFPPTDW